MIKTKSLVPNTSASLQRTLLAEAHIGKGQFLLEGQTLCKGKSYRTPTVSKTEG
jgi:hypothetical protein